MIPLPPTLKLVIALILTGAIPVLNGLSVAVPAWAGWIGTVVGILTVLETYFTIAPPTTQARVTAMKASLAKYSSMVMLVCLFAIGCAVFEMAGVLLAGCTSSTWQQLVSSIQKGLENGTLLANLEQIVAQYFPQFAGDAAALDTILQSVISLLQSTGVLTPAEQMTAKALQDQITAKLAAAKKAGWVMPSDAADAVARISRGEHPELVAVIAGQVAR